MLEKPNLDPHQFAVGHAEYATGKILTADKKSFFLDEGDVFLIFDSKNEAMEYINRTVKETPSLECWMEDSEGRHVITIDPRGERKFSTSGRLQQFLNELSDSELANFYSYRYHQFMKGSKEKIDSELNKRRMNVEDLEKYKVISNPISSEKCPQCASEKFYTSTEIETINYSYASVDLEVDYRTCLVCLYAEGKDESSSSHRSVGPVGFIRALINRKR